MPWILHPTGPAAAASGRGGVHREPQPGGGDPQERANVQVGELRRGDGGGGGGERRWGGSGWRRARQILMKF